MRAVCVDIQGRTDCWVNESYLLQRTESSSLTPSNCFGTMPVQKWTPLRRQTWSNEAPVDCYEPGLFLLKSNFIIAGSPS